MRLIDCYPARGTFAPGQRVALIVEVAAPSPGPAAIRLIFTHLDSPVAALTHRISPAAGANKLTFEWQAPAAAPCGYGARVELLDASGAVIDTASTAFDILPRWTDFPRYGFLTDLSPDRTDTAATVDALARFHINGLQFYDWQYRHDHLMPPRADYNDPLGRQLSLHTIRSFIETAHAHGMAALPYLSIYAASAEFWRAHPGWALYDSDGRAIPFGEDFLGLMNPTPGGPWTRHLLNECSSVLAALPFDGLHVDQYGEPHVAFDEAGQPVDLPASFAGFTAALKAAHPSAAVLFNAVGNWPIEALTASPQDFAYIEIWPPATAYRDVQHIVAGARVLSGGKPVVIALYLPADRPANVRLADALIFSSGGSRIELGERARLLSDPYFPKHQPLPDDLNDALRRYYDFAVRYGELIGPTAEDVPDCPTQTPPGVWAIVRQTRESLTVCLINVSGLNDPRWDEPHPAPRPLANVPLRVTLPQPAQDAWWASPDRGQPDPLALVCDTLGDDASVTIPQLDYWAIVTFKLDTQTDTV